jgi:transcriptional regulator with XRE-family HTH domain
VQDEVERITARVRRWRAEVGLTLQELGDRSGVSPSTIHKIENGNSVPTVSVLLKIASGLGRRPNELFEDEPGELPAACVRAGTGGVLHPQAGTELQRVIGAIPQSLIDLWRVVHQPGAGAGLETPLSYDGELVILVEQGELAVEIADCSYHLSAGDSLHFDTSAPHHWRNAGAGTVQMLLAGLLPRGLRKGLAAPERVDAED